MNKILENGFHDEYAVPQFNMNGIIWLETILKTAESCKAPVIIGTTDRIVSELGGFEFLVNAFQLLKKRFRITVPVVLHLDHGQSVESCFQAIDAGYDSVMFDGSSLPIEENIEKTKQVVEYAKKFQVQVEGEVGSVGGTEDGMTTELAYADQNECIRLVQEAGIDSLAPALGSVHGRYQGEPNLGFEEMKSLREAVQIPFVLHGASGISDEDLQRAISYGHSKINYNTELNIAWSNALRNILQKDTEIYAPLEILKPSKEAMSETITAIFKRTGAFQRVK